MFIIRWDDISNLKECLVIKITVKSERCFLPCLYRSPSQNREQFQSFCDSLNILMDNIISLNPAISIIAWDFSGNWLNRYFDTSGNTGKELDIITSTAGYTRIIDKLTHFTKHSFFCIELIFISNPSTIVDSGIEKSHCNSCHQDIIYQKINFRVPFTPPNFRTIWDCKNTYVGSFQLAIKNFICQYEFESKTDNEKVQVLNEVLMHILGNFVPHKSWKFNYKKLPWRNPNIFFSGNVLNELFYKNSLIWFIERTTYE